LLDLCGQGHIKLDRVEKFVLDEADRMLDMGFLPDVRRIASALPNNRQTLLFSATMSSEIGTLASSMLHNPAKVAINAVASVSDNISQKVLFVEQMHKRALLTGILKGKSVHRALIFTRTKHQANRISQQLSKQGISADAIHSNKSQSARQKALAAFDRGHIKVLVGTDIVARGIDVEGISHVINYELPEDPENYVHRIGRTARAGAMGLALSFCDAEEVPMLRGIERLTRCTLTAVEDHPYHSSDIAAMRDQNTPAQRKRSSFRSGSVRRSPIKRSGTSSRLTERDEKSPSTARKFGRGKRTPR
jgi:ATP-dependent RNA helicase RhlE